MVAVAGIHLIRLDKPLDLDRAAGLGASFSSSSLSMTTYLSSEMGYALDHIIIFHRLTLQFANKLLLERTLSLSCRRWNWMCCACTAAYIFTGTWIFWNSIEARHIALPAIKHPTDIFQINFRGGQRTGFEAGALGLRRGRTTPSR